MDRGGEGILGIGKSKGPQAGRQRPFKEQRLTRVEPLLEPEGQAPSGLFRGLLKPSARGLTHKSEPESSGFMEMHMGFLIQPQSLS